MVVIIHNSGATRVGVTHGVTPIFLKNLTTFLVITVCQFYSVTPIFVLIKLTTFFAHHCHFLDFNIWCHPLEGVTLDLFTCPTSFVHCSL